jgi:PTS system N-acetylgalactosamine-specific IID component
MASEDYVIPEHYQDLTPAAPLDQKTLNKMVWRSLFLQASFNYERMQACGWLYSILPGLEKIHTNKDDLAASMSHNMEFFNTHPFLVTFVMGIVLSLEQNKVDIPTIRAVRVSAMGPLGGIGDALFWFTLVPITAGITANMAIAGSIAAPFIFLIIFNVAQFVVRFWLMNWSYKMGTNAISVLTENAKEFTRAASILGVFVVGCLTVCYGGTKLGLLIPNGTTNTATAETAVVSNSDLEAGKYDEYLFSKGTYKDYEKDATSVTALTGTDSNKKAATASVTDLGNGSSSITFIQNVTSPVTIDVQSILDGICPKLIPLGITMLLYMLMAKKNWTPIKCICLVLAIGLVGSGFGLWVSIW